MDAELETMMMLVSREVFCNSSISMVQLITLCYVIVHTYLLSALTLPQIVALKNAMLFASRPRVVLVGPKWVES